MASIFKEYHLSSDNFDEPKITTGKKAIGVLLVRLLLLEPGTNPVRPEMGVGLASRYRYISEDNLAILQKDIKTQIRTYLYPFPNLNVQIQLKNHQLILTIIIDNSTYNFITEEQEGNKVTLTELLN